MRILIALFIALCIQQSAFSSSVVDINASDYIKVILNVSNYAKISGTVSDVIKNNYHSILLNFGKSAATSFSAKIEDSSINDFISAGIVDFKTFYADKNVSVEGVVMLLDGKPEILIKHPSQIKIIE